MHASGIAPDAYDQSGMVDLRCASVLASGMAKILELRSGFGGVCLGGAAARR